MNHNQKIQAGHVSVWENIPRELFLIIIEYMILAAKSRSEALQPLQVAYALHSETNRRLRSKVCEQLAKLKYEEDRDTDAGRFEARIIAITSTPDTVAAATADRRNEYLKRTSAMFKRCLLGVDARDEPETEADLLPCKPLDFYTYLCRPGGMFQRRFRRDLETNPDIAVSNLKDLLVQYGNSPITPNPPTSVSIYTLVCACGGPMATHILAYFLERDFTYLGKQGVSAERLMVSHRNALLLACLDGLAYRASLKDFRYPSQTAAIIGYLCSNQYVKWSAVNVIGNRARLEHQRPLSEYLARHFSVLHN